MIMFRRREAQSALQAVVRLMTRRWVIQIGRGEPAAVGERAAQIRRGSPAPGSDHPLRLVAGLQERRRQLTRLASFFG